MSRTTKAVMLSLFIFPGAGHFFLKRKLTGALLLGVSLACLYFVVMAAVAISQEISSRMLSGEIPLNALEVHQAISEQRSGAAFESANGAGLLLLVVWLLGILDAFRVGRSQRAEESGQPPGNPADKWHQS